MGANSDAVWPGFFNGYRKNADEPIQPRYARKRLLWHGRICLCLQPPTVHGGVPAQNARNPHRAREPKSICQLWFDLSGFCCHPMCSRLWRLRVDRPADLTHPRIDTCKTLFSGRVHALPLRRPGDSAQKPAPNGSAAAGSPFACQPDAVSAPTWADTR